MTFHEQCEALKKKFTAKITAESKPEEIEEANANASEVDQLVAQYDELSKEHAKVKDTLVRLVTTQGDSTPPKDDSQAKQSMSIEEAVEKVKQGGK